MKVAAVVVALGVSIPAVAGAEQKQGRATRQAAPATTTSSDRIADAYVQFLLGHHLDGQDDEAGAIVAFKRAMELDPVAADIPAELAALYLRQNKIQEAISAAEQALKLAPANREGNRVLGTIYAAMADSGRDSNRRRSSGASSENSQHLAKATQHLELAIDGLGSEADPRVRATLARAYIAQGDFNKAIPLLSTLVNEQPQWQELPLLLAEAFTGAGRTQDAIAWLEPRADDDPRLLPTLADLYDRGRRWQEAADTYGKALQRAPRSTELRTRYAAALINAGGRANVGKARGLLNELLDSGSNDAPLQSRLLYLLSQAERRLGDPKAAEAAARRVIAQNAKSAWGYYALAEALEERRAYQAVIDELSPIVAQNRGKPAESFDITILLPHLGFAYQELGQHDKAIATFEEVQHLAPKDPGVAGYLVEANIVAKKYDVAIEVAKTALANHPDNARLLRLQARALGRSGKPDQAIALLEDSLSKHADDPTSYIALAQVYSEAARGAQAVKVLEDAQARFPQDNAVTFELGAVFDKQRRFSDAEAAFQRVIRRDPDHAAALNYLGYMLAERGERLDESVDLLKKALTIDPDNGSYLDSLGWAYFKAEQLDLAEDNLSRAADQLRTNSVVQDHYADLLFKLGRYNDAIAAWNRALAGDGDSIDRGEIDKKIRSAKQKINKK